VAALAALVALAALLAPACNDKGAGPDGGGAGAIAVTSAPTGAAIFLNGNPTGAVTDATLSGLAPGNYTVAVAKECKAPDPLSRDVTVAADQTTQTAFTLADLTNTGSVDVSSTPAEAEIFVDGAPAGKTTPATLPCVAAGSHVISVAIDGYSAAPESLVVNVTVGGSVDAAFDLSIIAQSRIVLVDHFSNTSCDPCRIPEENLETARSALGSDVFVSIASHLNFPSAADPFYLANAQQFLERGASIIYMPVILADGDSLAAPEYNDYTTLRATIEAAAAVAPSYDVIVRTKVVGDSLVAYGTVRKRAATADDDVLTVAVIETDIDYDAANGNSHFDDIVRRFLPGTAGEAISVAVGAEHDFRYAVRIGSGWAVANLEAVAWVRSPSTGTVHQTGSGL
jgi:hypothetical protein